MTERDDHLLLAISTARAAGEALMTYYRTTLACDQKGDGSPVTLADHASHRLIAARLKATGLPIVSEEGHDFHMEATNYWLIDPLDGTKEFLASEDEFTVNVALLEDGRPVLGVVYAPAFDELYAGLVGNGAWSERGGRRMPCALEPKSQRLRMATSRFHDHADAEIFARANGVADRVSIGSALKYGRLAAAGVDVYPRLTGTSEWDTAAGQAVLEAAGGRVLDWHTGEPLRYGKAGRRNGRFLALRAPYTVTDFHRVEYAAELL